MLYTVAILQKPTPAEAKKGEQEKLLVAPFHLIAPDDQAAGLAAILDHGDKIPADAARDRLEVLVRPF